MDIEDYRLTDSNAALKSFLDGEDGEENVENTDIGEATLSDGKQDAFKTMKARIHSQVNLRSRTQFTDSRDIAEMLSLWQDKFGNTKQKSLYNQYEGLFAEWHSLLNNRFHLAFYGVGSPKELLEHFCLSEISISRPVLILNGFYPSLTLKDFLKAISGKILQNYYGLEEVPTAQEALLTYLEDFFSRKGKSLVLLIHSLDELIRLHIPIWEVICNRFVPGKAHVQLIVSVESHFAATAIPPALPFVWYPLVTGSPYTQEYVFRAHATAMTSAAKSGAGGRKLDENAANKILTNLPQGQVLVYCMYANLALRTEGTISIVKVDELLEKVNLADAITFQLLENQLNHFQSLRLLKRNVTTQTIESLLDSAVMRKLVDDRMEVWALYAADLL